MRWLSALFSVLFFFTVPVLYRCVAGESSASAGLTFQFKNSSAIFLPQEPVLLNITQPNGEGKHLTVSVLRADGLDAATVRHKTPLTELAIQVPPQEHQVPALPIPVSFLAPQDEGIYTVSIKVTPVRSGLIQNPFQRRDEFLSAETAVQFAVLDPKPVQRPVGTIEPFLQYDLLEAEGNNSFPWRRHLAAPVFPKVGSISVPKMPELPKLPAFRERLTGNTPNANTEPEVETELKPEVAEETLTLSIKEPGKVHLLEVEYLCGIPQKTEIRIEEPGAEPVISGIYIAEEAAAEPSGGRTAKHRVIFYPKTKQALVRFVNKESRQNERENIHKVHLYPLGSALPDTESLLPKPFAGKTQRQVLGYLRHPDDWKKYAASDSLFFTGSKRFTELLQYGGYSGMMLGVLSGSSALYPSLQLQNTQANQPVPDTLELIARLFDREELMLIPAVNFNMPLPSIEKLVRENPAMSSELFLSVYVPAEHGSVQTQPKFQYNLFHPVVQGAILDIVRELLQRYSKHPSFGGIAIQLNPDSYAQLPLFLNAVDDLTFQEFQNAEQKNGTLSFPTDIKQWDGTAKARFVQNEPKIREAWFRWRIQKTTNFYHLLGKTVTEYRPDAKFYLAGSEMLDNPELQKYVSPALPRLIQPIQLIRSLGIDPVLLNESPACVFLNPVCISPQWNSQTATEQEFDFFEARAGFVHNEINSGTLLDHGRHPAAVSVEHRSRRRFVRQLALFDTETFVDGGSFLPIGEEMFLHDFVIPFRQLPPVPFQTFQSQEQKNSLQPVTVRYHRTSEKLFIYLLNDAPFGVAATLAFSSAPNTAVTELSGRRTLEPMSNNEWTVSLQPYDFIAVTLNDSKAVVRNVSVHKPAAICGQGGILEQKVHQLTQRIHLAQSGIVWDKLENPNFEVPAEGNIVPGWSTVPEARLDAVVKRNGNNSLQLSASADSVNNLSGLVQSNSFELPPTGKLYLSLYLGIPDGTVLPRLEAVIAEEAPPASVPLSAALFVSKIVTDTRANSQLPDSSNIRWHHYFISFDRIAQLSQRPNPYYLGFRLREPGTVWIDDISLYQFTVNSAELKELQRILLAAGERQRAGRVSDLLSILESYWVRFLNQYVPMPVEHILPLAAVTAQKVAANGSVSGNAASAIQMQSPKKKKESSMFERFKNWISSSK